MIEFITDPLRLVFIVAGLAVVFGILFFGRRSNNDYEVNYKYKGRGGKDYNFGSPPSDTLVDEEVIVIPRPKKESEVVAEKTPHFSANIDDAEMHATETPLSNEGAEPPVDDEPPVVKPVLRQRNKGSSPKVEKAEIVLPTRKAIKAEPPLIKASKPASPPKQKFVVLHIVADEGEFFNGKSIFNATQTLGMAVGKHNVFHYPADAAYVGDSAFCLVNMTAEGTFDIGDLAALQTTGISLILTLPTNYSDGLTVFSNMLAVAHGLTKKLGGGNIVDQTRSPLTAELMASMEKDISQFESQLKEPEPA